MTQFQILVVVFETVNLNVVNIYHDMGFDIDDEWYRVMSYFYSGDYFK